MYTIDFKSSKTFIAIILLCLGMGGLPYVNYSQYQENKQLRWNDVKYRYVQMKGGIITDDILYLNNSFSISKQFRDSI